MVIVGLVVELCEIIVALSLDHCWIMFGLLSCIVSDRLLDHLGSPSGSFLNHA